MVSTEVLKFIQNVREEIYLKVEAQYRDLDYRISDLEHDSEKKRDE